MRMNGMEFPAEPSIGVLQTAAGPLFHAFINDLTEKKRLEKQIESLLHEHEGLDPVTARSHSVETRFQRLFNNMHEGVQVLEPDLRYRFVNDSAVAQSRYSRGQLIGRTMIEMYPGVESTSMYRCLLDCLAQQAPLTFMNEFTFPDSHVGFFELSIQPIPDGILILSTDVTELRRAERDLQLKKQQLEQQNAELERFAYVATHDLHEPLRMVASYLQLLERRYDDRLDGDARDFLNYAIDGAQRMKKLIGDLLVYFRADRPLPAERILLSDVLEDVLRDLAASIEEAGASFEVQGALPEMHAPRTVVSQILQNLISNAIKFRHPDRPSKVIFSGEAHDIDTTITISDNGIGIDPDFGDRIFNPFTRHTDSASIPGAGIDMSIVRKHVTRLGGRIWYESEHGKGSTFHLCIPINPIAS